jgi:hypothetical protein
MESYERRSLVKGNQEVRNGVQQGFRGARDGKISQVIVRE